MSVFYVLVLTFFGTPTGPDRIVTLSDGYAYVSLELCEKFKNDANRYGPGYLSQNMVPYYDKPFVAQCVKVDATTKVVRP